MHKCPPHPMFCFALHRIKLKGFLFMKKSARFLSMGLASLSLLYSIAGALAASPEPTTAHTAFWHDPIYIENVEAGFINEHGRNIQPFSYNGTIYMPLRGAGEWMGCKIEWNQNTQTVSLTSGGNPYYLNIFTPEAQPEKTQEEIQQLLWDSDNGIDIQINPNISVVLDGVKKEFRNVKGELVYPAVFRDSVYLPIRSIGELCGKTVVWMPPTNGDPGMVFIFDAPTQQQIEEIQTYYASCERCYSEISAAVENLAAADNISTDGALSKLTALKSMIQDLKNLAHPSAPFFEGYACFHIRISAWYLEDSVNDYISYMRGDIATPGGIDWNNLKDSFSTMVGQHVISFRTELETIHDLMNAVGIGMK